MKRFHVHVAVENLDQSIRFYSTLFATEPTVRKPDYAKWMLDDPRVNFTISQRRVEPGIEHLGIQVENEAGHCHVNRKFADQMTMAVTVHAATVAWRHVSIA